MLFNDEELGTLNKFKNTASILNNIFVTFIGFDIKIVPADVSESLIKFDSFLFLNKLKESLVRYDRFITYNHLNEADFDVEVLNFSSGLKDSFALYTSDNSQFLLIILSRVNAFYKWSSDYFRSRIIDASDIFTPLLDFDEILNNVDNNGYRFFVLQRGSDQILPLEEILIIKNQILEFKNIKNDFLNLQNKYNELLEDNKKHVSEFFESESSDFNSAANSLMSDFQDFIKEIKRKYEIEAKVDIEKLGQDVQSSSEELSGLFGDINSYKSLISIETENEISKYYSSKAKAEKRTYWGATIISVSIILAAIVSAWCGLNSYFESYVSVEQCTSSTNYKECIERLEVIRKVSQNYAFYYLIMRLIFSFLLFLTVIYTSRIAIRAYTHWRHSENMHLKLASLRPFINQLSPEERAQIHKDLVPDYFGKDAGMVDGVNEKFKDLPANVSAIAMKAIEQIGSGGGNSEGKNDKKEEA